MHQENLFKTINQLTKESQNESVETEPVNEAIENIDNVKLGVVSDCIKLNVRKEPKVGAPITCEVDCGTELMIDEKESTDEFYKVCTAAGIEGFCMKKFIAVQI